MSSDQQQSNPTSQRKKPPQSKSVLKRKDLDPTLQEIHPGLPLQTSFCTKCRKSGHTRNRCSTATSKQHILKASFNLSNYSAIILSRFQAPKTHRKGNPHGTHGVTNKEATLKVGLHFFLILIILYWEPPHQIRSSKEHTALGATTPY